MKRSTVALAAALVLAAAAQTNPTASELWNWLKTQNFTERWRHVPGKPAGRFEGGPPHGAFQQVFVNDLAFEALSQKRFPLPEGAVIVKENYDAEGRLYNLAVMRKVKGYNPEGGDWFWGYFTPEGGVLFEGKPALCVGCHAQKKASDWVFSGQE
ncbi:cytochrome P460 family protein [Deinococcota bacterium DY0809b]